MDGRVTRVWNGVRPVCIVWICEPAWRAINVPDFTWLWDLER